MDEFEKTVEAVEQFVNGDYHTIKMGDLECRLFKSLENRRLIELGETFDEYKLRLRINKQMVKRHKQGIVEPINSNI